MIDIKSIITKLDDYLQLTGKKSIGPVEANKMLSKYGLLKDSKDRPGKPLRELLRKGLIKHAYQTGGKGSEWAIPLSNSLKEFASNYSPTKTKKYIPNKTISSPEKSMDILQLKMQLDKARENYKPKQVKYLLIAEAPPDSIDRFFYYEEVFKHDDLFIGVTKVLYPKLKDKHLASRRRKDGSMKKFILEKLKGDGFFLLDLSELPLSLLTDSLTSQVPLLIDKIKVVADKKTKIILIKTNVYDTAFSTLTGAGMKNVINCRITFPGSGGQTKFQLEFTEALRQAKYIWLDKN